MLHVPTVDCRRPGYFERRRAFDPGLATGVRLAYAADGGWKYLSTEAWTGDIDAVTERARRIVYF